MEEQYFIGHNPPALKEELSEFVVIQGLRLRQAINMVSFDPLVVRIPVR